ncbi:Histidine phosphatase superfamily clade-1 [Penicillium expansum]|nr:Histidine phosphatase superfamily clade-1 [Penicillium expansum]
MRLSTLGSALVGLAVAQASTINYSAVTGYFLQDEESTDASTFDYTAENFGLIDRAYPADKDYKKNESPTQWERFYNQVTNLNEHSPRTSSTRFCSLVDMGKGGTMPPKLIMAHQRGTTNLTISIQCYWSELSGNSTASWADAALTPGGVTQALIANEFWQKEINEQRIHTPDQYYVSPLTRTLQTANITFGDLDLPKHSAKFKPTIKELFREGISIHTCDHRRSRSYIHDLFPHWSIEHGFTEKDELWNGVTAETSGAQDVRSAQALGQVFFTLSKKKSFVSITSHSGEISSILRVIGHRTFRLSTGAVIPVLVKAERIGGKAPATSSVPWEVSPHCTEPPVTSATACVCPSSAAPVTTPLATGF